MIAAMEEQTNTPETFEASEKKSRHRYANALSAQVAAAVNGLYRFKTVEQAQAKLEGIRRNFTVAREQEETALPSLTLWMRDFELQPEEEEKGYVGHFGRLQIEEQEDGLYTINAYKVEKALKHHPVRKRPVSRTPNWGHPILRGILKGKQYDTLEAAQSELQALQMEYPETTLPAQNKLYLMIFSRREDPKKPLKKYVLEIKNLQGGGFTIEHRVNDYKPKTKRALPGIAPLEGDDAAPAPEKPGHFASMVSLKRKKK